MNYRRRRRLGQAESEKTPEAASLARERDFLVMASLGIPISRFLGKMPIWGLSDKA
jgi:hypothetical protein